jgi:F-type H+-transporting ATPase subunit gamma
VFERLLPKSLNMQMWKVLLETNASYQSARMIAMESATKNAAELITKLSLIYNKARQSAITKEILEIVSGAEALKGA